MDDWEGEDQFLIRVPPDLAVELRERIKTNNFKRLKMTVGAKNKATLTIGKKELHGKMCMPPTYIESLKTYDNKAYFKSADICQMAVFKETADEANCIPTQLNSGLTPAAKRIRRRRARRNPGEKDFEPSAVRDVETALMQTINQTDGAVTYEVIEVTDDEAEDAAAMDAMPPKKKQKRAPKEKKESKDGKDGKDGAALSSATGATGAAPALSSATGAGAALSSATGADDTASLNGSVALSGVTGVTGATDDDDEEEDDDDAGGDDGFAAAFEEEGLFDDDDDDDNKSQASGAASGATQADTSDDGGDSDDSGDSDDEQDAAMERQRKTLREEIVRIDAQCVEAQMNVAMAANPIIAERCEDEIAELMIKKKQLESDLAAISAK